MRSGRVIILALGACLSAALNSLAAYAEGPQHTDLAPSTHLDYGTVFAAATRRAPQALEQAARGEQAAAWDDFGSGWTRGGPRFTFNALDDSLRDDIGQRELEAALEWQLLRPAARRNTQALASAYSRETEAYAGWVRLSVAGQLRETLHAMAAARLRLAQADAAQQAAQSLLDIAQQQLAAGAVAEDAVLHAEALLLEQRSARLAADAALVDAERTYQTLTGLGEYPAAPFREQRSARAAVGPEHPLLHYLGIAGEVAASQADQAREQTRGNPTLSIGVAQQRPDDFNPANDSLVVGLSIPLGGGAAARAQASDAHRQQAAVAAQYADARRTLQLRLHEVEHELEISHSQLALLERQRELAGRRARMAREAFAAGEYRMDQVVLAEREAQRVKTEYALLTARQEQLISEYNQAVGVLP